MVIMPPTDNRTPDHSNTPAGATAIGLSESFQGRIDSADDVDYFRLRVDSPGTLTIRTTGNGDPDIAVFDGAGNEVPGVRGSWIGGITQDILDRGSDVLVRFSGGNAGGEYTGRATLDQTPQTSPDLVVGSPTVSDGSPETGGAFTLSATVSNHGNGESTATTLRYYRSTDATITTSDTEVGTDAVAGLAPSGSDSQSVELVAPSAPGTYHYGACVDAVAGESNTANNCSTSVQVTVREPAHPDLTVVSPSVSDNSPAVGSQFTLSATVQNDGNGESAATTLRYFLSTDATITTSDTEVGTDAVAGLAASGGDRQSVELAAPSAPGTYHYGACGDAVAGESDTANNCSPSVQVTVLQTQQELRSHPDLDGGDAFGERRQPGPRGEFHPVGDGAERRQRRIGGDDAALLPVAGRDHHDIGHGSGDGRGGRACAVRERQAVGGRGRALGARAILLRRVRGRGGGRVRYGQQLLHIRAGNGAGAGPSGSDGGVAFGERRQPGRRGEFHPVGDGAERRQRRIGGDDAALLPVDGRDHHDIGHGSGDGGGGRACAVRKRQSVGGVGRALGARAILLRGVRGRGGRRVQCGQQLLHIRARHCIADPTAVTEPSGPGGGNAHGKRQQPGPRGEFHPVSDGAERRQRRIDGDDATLLPVDGRDHHDIGHGSGDGRGGRALRLPGATGSRWTLAAPSAPGPYYYGACVDAVAGESNTANNCSPSVQVTVLQTQQQLQSRPDLEVGTPTVSDDSPAPGASFTLSATVQNDGNGESTGTTLRYFRSTDATITTSDTEVGTEAVAGLAPSGSDRQSVDMAAPSAPGPYYYGACVDAVAGESDTANNCSTSVQVTVREPDHPDLTVVSPSVSDNSPAAGVSFTLSATVQNDGNGESAATTLRYFRSTDATITTSDTEVGTDAVAGLAPSGSDSQSVELAAPSAPGPYYYGACVDAVAGESDTANNCSPSVQVTVREPDHPELTVVSPSVSNSSPAVGSQFTLSATVQNDGNGESAATTLRYYRSTDATITTSDTEVGTDAVAGLAPSGSDRQSVDMAAPSAPGPYYYGACVDAVAGESDTANNCSPSVQVTVREPDHPDLTVVSPSVSDDSPAPGASFTLSATVQNDGNGESAATTLRYYRSTDATITTSDTEVGTDAVAGLARSGSDRQSVDVAAPSAPGPYYYGACVDAVAGESNTANNCSTSVQVTVREPDHPDLTVVSPSVSDDSPAPGASFTLSATVQNDGNGESAGTTLRYYRSPDATITTSDTEVGTDAVAGLAPSGSDRQSVELVAPSAPGTYHYGACVDAVAGESDAANNCSTAVQVTVREPAHPDLMVVSPSVSNNSPTVGSQFTLSATVQNDGNGESAATTLRYFRSTDGTITTSDTEVGTDAVAGLAPSESDSQAVDVAAPTAPGPYYYGACVDVVAGESNTANNCSTSVQVTVSQTQQQLQSRPDLEVGTPTVSDNSPVPGASFTLSATVSNTGGAASASTTLRYYRSTDATITTSDTQVSTVTVVALAAAGTSSKSVSLIALSVHGIYYYGACLDAVAGESDTTNNCSSSVEITVPSSELGSDLVVGSPTVSTVKTVIGGSFTVSATVSNLGDQASPSTTLQFYSSYNATVSMADTREGTATVPALGAAGTSSHAVSVTAPSIPGTWYYGACVNGVAGESDKWNNCSVTVAVTVLRKADLVVGSPTVNNSSPVAGTSFTVSATVRNTGRGASESTTLRYYRSTDATITTSDTQVGTDAVPALGAAGNSSQSLSMTASIPGTWYYGACVDAVAGESDTNNNCSSSVEVTFLPTGLVVGELSAIPDNNLLPGWSFSFFAMVRNTGRGTSPSTTLRYYSSPDATITTSDTLLGTDTVRALRAGSIRHELISLIAPSSYGIYYYGVCLDVVAGEPDTGDCSPALTVTVLPADLVVGSPTVDNSTPEAGTRFTLRATVRNTGRGASPLAELRYYRSTDATITTSDVKVAFDYVGERNSMPGLPAGGAESELTYQTAPLVPGTWYYGACVEAVAGESDTTNNCSSSVAVTVPPRVDLVAGSPAVSAGGPVAGTAFTLSASVSNTGIATSASTTLRYYRSTDATITTLDTSVGTAAVGALAPAGTGSQTISVTAPASSGIYYYGACVDTVTHELDTTDNCSSSVRVTVVSSSPGPDLVVRWPTVSAGKTVVGASFTLSATVFNLGSGASTSTTLGYYRSTDATITTSDTSEGTAAVGALAATGSSSGSLSVTAPSSPGTYYYGACVTTVTGESGTTNNCSSSVRVTVLLKSDLVVGSPTADPTNPLRAGTFSLSARAYNVGDGRSPRSTLRFYRSTDATITTSDTFWRSRPVREHNTWGSSGWTLSVDTPSRPGTYYYGACVDAVAGESDTTNNCSSAVTVTVR